MRREVVVYQNKRKRQRGSGGVKGKARLLGEGLVSRDVTVQVPSALAGLTAGFQKGPGAPPPPHTPRNAGWPTPTPDTPPLRLCQGSDPACGSRPPGGP